MADLLKFPFDHKFDVTWTNRADTFAHVIGQMYKNQEQFDLIIQLDGDKHLLAHRHVMAILSPEIRESLEEELNSNGSFVSGSSEVELHNIPHNVMEKILEFVYYGSTRVCKWEMKKFCNVLTRLGITTFYDREIKDYIKKLKAKDDTAEMVYRGRGRLIAEGFEQMFCDQRWFDISIEVECLAFEAHRVALSIGSVYFRETFRDLPPTTMATTVEAQVDLSFEKTYNMIAFIYSGWLALDDITDYLNAGESLEILGLLGCDELRANEPKRDQPSNEHKVFVTATNIPADHPLRTKDLIRKTTATAEQKLAKKPAARKSSSSTSGSEYDVEKDSDHYSDSDDGVPLVTEYKQPKLQRAATSKALKAVQPQKCSNGQKRTKANAAVRQEATAGGSRAKASTRAAEKSVTNVAFNGAQEEMTYTISKSDYELFMRLLQRNADGDVVEDEYGQNEQATDEILDQAVDEYQQQNADDPEYQAFDDGDQYSYGNYDDDVVMEGVVGGSLNKYDENDNALESVDGSNGWADEYGYGNDYMVEQVEEPDTNNHSEQMVFRKENLKVRTWTDADYTELVAFDKSPKGAIRLILDGYFYTQNKTPTQANDYQRWRCANVSKFRCKARTKTKMIKGIEMAQPVNPPHNHDPVC